MFTINRSNVYDGKVEEEFIDDIEDKFRELEERIKKLEDGR